MTTTRKPAALTSLNTRFAIAVAAVALSALQLAGVANLATADTQMVMLERVEVVGQRAAQPDLSVAQAAQDQSATRF
jgi:hypothetical protein